MPAPKSRLVVRLSPRGGLTLPTEILRAAGIVAGDTLIVSVEHGRILLQPAAVVPIERYSDERVREFAESAEMSATEISRAERKWGV